MFLKLKKTFWDELEIEYRHHPRLFWITFCLAALFFVLSQSYLAQPRALVQLLKDGLLPLLVVLSAIYIFLRPKARNLLFGGLFFLALTALVYFFNFIPKPYGTFFFLIGIWYLVDWYNFRKNKRCLISELMRGNYKLAAGVFMAAFIFGLLTEFVNLPFMIWQYQIPLPSLDIFGFPALIAAFGWLPWVMSILAIFYFFSAKA